MNHLPKTQVAVIGAGFSGMSAARKLHKAGIDVRVLEARDRTGGRIWDPILKDGRTVLLGGQWVSKKQTRMWTLGQEFGLTPFTTVRTGDMLVANGSGAIRIPQQLSSNEELDAVISELETMAETVPVDAPWKAPNALEWDAQTLHTWIINRGGPELLNKMDSAIMGYMSLPEDVSLLHALFYTRANGGFASLFSIGDENAHDTHVFAEGAQRITEGIYNELEARVHLNCLVYAIHQNNKGVYIQGAGFSLEAERVIVAMPPAMSARLHFKPSLPAERNFLTQRSHMSGLGAKFVLMFNNPFWREKGLCGLYFSETGAITITLDATPDHENWAVLVGFVSYKGSGKDLMNMTLTARESAIIDLLSSAYGEQIRDYVSYHEHDWAEDDFSRGCVTVFSTSTWTSYGSALREPVDRIHWAGTETATEFPGQMEGAVRAGERTADEVIAEYSD